MAVVLNVLKVSHARGLDPLLFLPSLWLTMPLGVNKPRRPKLFTDRRRNTIFRIETLGRQLFNMGRCTPC